MNASISTTVLAGCKLHVSQVEQVAETFIHVNAAITPFHIEAILHNRDGARGERVI